MYVTFREKGKFEFGGEGVATGAEDCPLVPDEAEGTRRARAGVEKPEPLIEPRERSGCVPAELVEVFACMFRAADMTSSFKVARSARSMDGKTKFRRAGGGKLVADLKVKVRLVE